MFFLFIYCNYSSQLYFFVILMYKLFTLIGKSGITLRQLLTNSMSDIFYCIKYISNINKY